MQVDKSTIIKGRLDDLASTVEMFVLCTDFLKSLGINQWDYTYPDRTTLEEDIALGSNYVIKHGSQVICSMAVDGRQDDQYQKVHWKYRNDEAAVLHRVGVRPDFHGKGLGKKICLFAEEIARLQGYKSIRLDAYAGNPISNRMYRDLGYTLANGYCYFHKQPIPFYCYEKVL